jgi:hypothetical protein
VTVDDNQFLIPQAFVALYLEPGRLKPALPREAIAERFELCEDMANLLTEQATQVLVRLGITEADVLRKLLLGLTEEGAHLGAVEALWVVCRTAELLGWPVPADIADPLPEAARHWLERTYANR